MTVINTNVKSLVAQSALAANNNKLATAMERLSTGSRINSAKDDAAGLAISTRMESQVRGLNAAIRNANDGISMAQTAEGAMEEISSMLQRMRELAVQASNGTYTSQDRANLDAEVQQLKSEIDRVVGATEFNNRSILNGSLSAQLQIGSDAGQTMTMAISDLSTLSLGTINGTSTTAGVTEGSFQGTQATPTEAAITFNGNGEFKFALEVDMGSIGHQTYNITGTVASGSAEDVVDAINSAIRQSPVGGGGVVAGAADAISASYNGRTVTINNAAGGLIKLHAGVAGSVTSGVPTMSSTVLSAAGTTATYTSVEGGTTSQNLILGGASGTGTAIDVTTRAVSDKAASSETYTFAGTTAAADVVQMTLTANGVTTVLQGTITAAGMDDVIAQLTADPAYSTSGFLISKDTATTLKVERYDGASFTVDASHLRGGAAVTTAPMSLTGAVGTTDIVAGGAQVVAAGATSSAEPVELALTVGGLATGATAGDKLAFDFVSGGVTQSVSVTLTGGANGDSVDSIITSLRSELATASITDYEVGKNGDGQVVVARKDGAAYDTRITQQVAAGTVATSNLLTMTTTGGAELISSTGFYSSANPTATSDMYLSLMGNDTYTLQFGQVLAGSATASPATATNPVTVTYDGTSASLTSIAADLEANLATLLKPAGNANNYDFSVTVEGGRLRVSEANGYDFALLGFESAGAGRISAALGDNQSGTGGVTSKLLDDTAYGLTASTTATSPALAATNVTLAFAPAATAAASDTYSFEITDGSATAVISNVLYDGFTTTDTSMSAAITSALKSSGLDSVMSVSYNSTSKEFTLTHALGKEVRIQNFQSDNSENLLIKAGTGTTGVTRYLDDNYTSAAGESVRSIAITSASLASDAVGIIDAALEDVAAERANLGAIQNRLDHTINNLTNISTNTSASRSRIQDTDYGMETANLAKAQIIQQAATAMLAQANQSAQSVLSLLQ